MDTRGDIKYKICLHKAYFEKGMQITSILKYFTALAGFGSIYVYKKIGLAFFLLSLYCVGCYVLGRIWFNKGFQIAEAEVGNQFNLFVREMRKVYKHKK